jgi:hypothetical protein
VPAPEINPRVDAARPAWPPGRPGLAGRPTGRTADGPITVNRPGCQVVRQDRLKFQDRHYAGHPQAASGIRTASGMGCLQPAALRDPCPLECSAAPRGIAQLRQDRKRLPAFPKTPSVPETRSARCAKRHKSGTSPVFLRASNAVGGTLLFQQ